MKNEAVIETTAKTREKKQFKSTEFSPEIIALAEKASRTIAFPHKYLPAQSRFIAEKTKEIHTATPALPIRQVVVQILSVLPDFLPPDNILDVTRQIVEQWQKLTAAAAAPIS
ncbi:MAG: hypothetical protein H6577_24940 [Lewinellaceae bacterium]|nr:hypothetical protein [Saprospiraceae bacterium]MCB9341384.1 hypothetical protein [Lewinellaceae bacterium]